MRTTLLVVTGALAALLFVGWLALGLWREMGLDTPPLGWAAYAGGAIGCLALSGALFYALFHSARHGYDDIDRPDS